MPNCPICQSPKLKAFKTRWWEKIEGRLVWRRECECSRCGWLGWLTAEALPGATIHAQIAEAREAPTT